MKKTDLILSLVLFLCGALSAEDESLPMPELVEEVAIASTRNMLLSGSVPSQTPP